MNLEHPTLAIRRGDSLDSVRNLLGLTSMPEAMIEPDGPGSFYHLEELGFWVFLNEEQQVYSLRFDDLYPYTIDGVRVGSTMEDVRNARGNPDRRFPVPDGKTRWIYDKPRFLRVDFSAEENRVEKIFR